MSCGFQRLGVLRFAMTWVPSGNMEAVIPQESRCEEAL